MPLLPALALASLALACTAAPSAPAAGTASAATTPEARHALAAAYSAAHAGDALLVWENGRLAFEAYQNGFRRGTPHRLNSGSKTLVGLVTLAAVEDRLVALDEPASRTLREWAADPAKARITVAQLLHLTAGLSTTVGQAPSFAAALRAPLVHAPGEGFRYGPTAFQATGALLERPLGGERVEAYLERRLLAPIGATVARWDRARGSDDPQLAGGAWMTADAWLRVGRLLLDGGRWDGRTVLRPSSLAALVAPTPASPGYGLATWLNTPVAAGDPFLRRVPGGLAARGGGRLIYPDGPADLYMAAGLNNQRLYVVPSRGLVAVRFGRRDRTWDDAAFLARLLDGRAP